MPKTARPSVLFLDHSSELGGAELYLIDYLTHFDGRCAVASFSPGPFRERLKALGIGVIEVDLPQAVAGVTRESTLWRDVRSIPGVAASVMRLATVARKYDVLFANTQKALVLGGLASLLSRRPLIWNLHDIMTTEHFSASHIRLARIFGNRFARRIVTNSEATRAALAAAGGRRGKMFVVYNGIDPAPFNGGAPPGPWPRNDPPKVGIFSRLARWKGQHVLIEAVARVPEVRLLLVGDALYPEDRQYKQEMLALIEHHNLGERVKLTGFVQDVPACLSSVDLVVHASTAPEPFGRVIVEGMMAGKPVIAASAGGAVEIVRHGETGWLTAPGSVEELAHAIGYLVDHPSEAAAIAEAGRRDALKRFALPAMVRALDEHIEACVHRG